MRNSATVARTDGSKVDFCHMKDEIVIGETIPATDSHHQIVLSLQEARALQSHLTSVLG